MDPLTQEEKLAFQIAGDLAMAVLGNYAQGHLEDLIRQGVDIGGTILGAIKSYRRILNEELDQLEVDRTVSQIASVQREYARIGHLDLHNYEAKLRPLFTESAFPVERLMTGRLEIIGSGGFMVAASTRLALLAEAARINPDVERPHLIREAHNFISHARRIIPRVSETIRSKYLNDYLECRNVTVVVDSLNCPCPGSGCVYYVRSEDSKYAVVNQQSSGSIIIESYYTSREAAETARNFAREEDVTSTISLMESTIIKWELTILDHPSLQDGVNASFNTTAGNYEGCYLDFNNHILPEPSGETACLILCNRLGAAAYWAISAMP